MGMQPEPNEKTRELPAANNPLQEFAGAATALQNLSDSLAGSMFARADSAATGDKIEISDCSDVGRVHGSALDEKVMAAATVEVTQIGVPSPIILGGEPVTVVPALHRQEISEFVLKPILDHEYYNGTEKNNPVEIKLALLDGKELTGKLTVEFKDVYSTGKCSAQ